MYPRKASFHVMRFNMCDSEPGVNRDAAGFETIIRGFARALNVQGNRDDVISGFVRAKIREWRYVEKRELQELARAAGFGKSTPSQVLFGTGVGGKTGPKFAKAFGYASYDAMKSAAWEWWKEQGQAGHDSVSVPKTEAMGEAIAAVLALGQGTVEQVETIMAAFAHARFRDRDKDWWIQTLLAELARDRGTMRDDKTARTETNSVQRQMRGLQRQRRPRAKHATPKRRAS